MSELCSLKCLAWVWHGCESRDVVQGGQHTALGERVRPDAGDGVTDEPTAHIVPNSMLQMSDLTITASALVSNTGVVL